MPIDPSIALQVRPVTVENPMNAMAKAYALKQAQQGMQMNALKMRQDQAAQEQQNALRQYLGSADLGTQQGRSGLMQFGKSGTDIMKSLTERQKAELDMAGKKLGLVAQLLGGVKDEATWQIARPQLAQIGDAQYMPQNYDPNWVSQHLQQGLAIKDQLDALKPVQVSAGAALVKPTGEVLFRNPATSTSGGGGVYGALTPDEQYAIGQAIAEGRLDPYRLNSRNARMLAQTLTQTPDANLNVAAGQAAMMRNVTYQTKEQALSSLPEVLQNVKEAGKKVNFNDNRYVGMVQAWQKGVVNDPDFTEYMVQRNDAMMSIAAAMRMIGMSDKAIEQEERAAPITMSPKAFEAWYTGQMQSLKPRLEKMQKYGVGDRQITGEQNAPSAGKTIDFSELP